MLFAADAGNEIVCKLPLDKNVEFKSVSEVRTQLLGKTTEVSTAQEVKADSIDVGVGDPALGNVI
jgi:hypothetical protein